MVADEDGIVIVPPVHAEDVLARVAQPEAGHTAIRDTLLRGEVTKIAVIERQLRGDGFEFGDTPAPVGRQE